MEMIKTNGFTDLSTSEMQQTDGGLALSTVLFTIGAIKVTVGLCLKAGAAIGLVAGGAVVLSR